MNVTIRESDGNTITFENVHLFTGVKDQNGVDIYEGDRVQVYIPNLDSFVPGTVEYSAEDRHPCWLVRLDEAYEHKHHFPQLHGIPSYKTDTHYLDGCDVTVIGENEK